MAGVLLQIFRTGRVILSRSSVGTFLGVDSRRSCRSVIDSMDEDCIYRRIHPEDLVEKRLLEYKFFPENLCNAFDERLKYRGRCRIRMMNEKGVYQYTLDNLVQEYRKIPSGSAWPIFVFYSVGRPTDRKQGIYPTITHGTWRVETLFLSEEHRNILSEREKEILRCIRKGLSSKEIATTLILGSVNTRTYTDRIFGETSSGNSIVAYAGLLNSMKLL